jgi:hypothetical protein
MVNGSSELVCLADIAHQPGDLVRLEFVFERRHRFVTVGDEVDHFRVGVLDCMIGPQRWHLELLVVDSNHAAVTGWTVTCLTVCGVVCAGFGKLND